MLHSTFLLDTFNNSDNLVDTVISLENQSLKDPDLINLLIYSENNDVKCWALLKLNWVNNDFESEYLVNLLLNKDSRLRELSSELINKHLLSEDQYKINLFDKTKFYEIFVHSITDVNPRVTRNTSSFFYYLSDCNHIFNLLLSRIECLKGPYELYWVLESIGNILQKVDNDTFQKNELYLTETLFRVAISNDKLSINKLKSLIDKKGKNIFSKDQQTINFIRSKFK